MLRADRVEPRLWLLVSALACEVLVAGGVVGDYTSAAALVERQLASGEAAERFSRMVAALGGPGDLLDGAARYLSRAPCVLPVGAERGGYVTTMDTRQIAMAIVKLGGGRQHPNDRVDHRVGVDGVIALGGPVERGDAMAVVHAADMDSARFAAKVIQQAVTVRDTQPPAAPIVLAHCRA